MKGASKWVLLVHGKTLTVVFGGQID